MITVSVALSPPIHIHHPEYYSTLSVFYFKKLDNGRIDENEKNQQPRRL